MPDKPIPQGATDAAKRGLYDLCRNGLVSLNAQTVDGTQACLARAWPILARIIASYRPTSPKPGQGAQAAAQEAYAVAGGVEADIEQQIPQGMTISQATERRQAGLDDVAAIIAAHTADPSELAEAHTENARLRKCLTRQEDWPAEVRRLYAELARVKGQRDGLLSVVKRLEYSSSFGKATTQACPACNAIKGHRQHAAYCWIAAAITAAEKETA